MSTIQLPSADELAQMPEATKRELLALLADDLIGDRACLPLTIMRGGRRVAVLVPDVWASLPPNNVTPEELARRANSTEPGLTTAELKRRVMKELAATDPGSTH
jgi:hypothetical protein